MYYVVPPLSRHVMKIIIIISRHVMKIIIIIIIIIILILIWLAIAEADERMHEWLNESGCRRKAIHVLKIIMKRIDPTTGPILGTLSNNIHNFPSINGLSSTWVSRTTH